MVKQTEVAGKIDMIEQVEMVGQVEMEFKGLIKSDDINEYTITTKVVIAKVIMFSE